MNIRLRSQRKEFIVGCLAEIKQVLKLPGGAIFWLKGFKEVVLLSMISEAFYQVEVQFMKTVENLEIEL